MRREVAQPWFVENPQALEEVRMQLEQFSTLHLVFNGDEAVVIGTLPLAHEDVEFDRYAIELHLTSDHPYSPPIIFEVGGRIPRILDRHVFNNGSLCLGVREQLWPDLGQKINLGTYINTHVRNYLLGNTFFELGRPWPFGERPHGAGGILQYYAEAYRITDASEVHGLLNYALNLNTKGHWDCFCGSKKKIRDCHLGLVQELRKTKHPDVLRYSLSMMEKSMQTDQAKVPIKSHS